MLPRAKRLASSLDRQTGLLAASAALAGIGPGALALADGPAAPARACVQAGGLVLQDRVGHRPGEPVLPAALTIHKGAPGGQVTIRSGSTTLVQVAYDRRHGPTWSQANITDGCGETLAKLRGREGQSRRQTMRKTQVRDQDLKVVGGTTLRREDRKRGPDRFTLSVRDDAREVGSADAFRVDRPVVIRGARKKALVRLSPSSREAGGWEARTYDPALDRRLVIAIADAMPRSKR